MHFPTLSLSLFLHLLSPAILSLPLTADPDLLESTLADSSSLFDSTSTSPTSTTTTSTDLFPNWSRSASWLGFRFVEHESHVKPILPTDYAHDWHIVNSPIRGVVTDGTAKHRLGITAKELDRVFQERVLGPQLRKEEVSGRWEEAQHRALEGRREVEREAQVREEHGAERRRTAEQQAQDRWQVEQPRRGKGR